MPRLARRGENRGSLASAGVAPRRKVNAKGRAMPVDFSYVVQLAYWKTSEAVAYLLNVDPDILAVRSEGNWRTYDKSRKLLEFIHRAIQMGQLQARPDTRGYDYMVRTAVFIEWAKNNELPIPTGLNAALERAPSPSISKASTSRTALEELRPTVHSPDKDNLEADCVAPTPGRNVEDSAFNPLLLNGIAQVFKIEADEKQNLQYWQKAARYANRNGLITARISTARGKAKSTFDPELVGEWLVNKGIMARDKVDNHLKRNLPRRSEHLKDLYSH
jgi:hypothetical protein